MLAYGFEFAAQGVWREHGAGQGAEAPRVANGNAQGAALYAGHRRLDQRVLDTEQIGNLHRWLRVGLCGSASGASRDQLPQPAARELTKTRAMQAGRAGKADQAAQDGIVKACLDQRG